MNRFSRFCALCTALILSVTSFADELTNYQYPDWNDYEITFVDPDDLWVSYGNYLQTKDSVEPNSTVSLFATVNVTSSEATLCFDVNNNQTFSLIMYIDGEKSQEYSGTDLYGFVNYGNANYGPRFFEKLTTGTHTIEWRLTNVESNYRNTPRIERLGVISSPEINASLLEPGSLGQEILHQVESIRDVRNLKISGRMNDEDWNIINMMKDRLIRLDLGNALIESFPERIFQYVQFLNEVVLPEGLETIGDDAFYNCTLSKVNFPSTLKSIGYEAFYRVPIREAVLPDNCTELDRGIFRECRSLRRIVLPKNLKVVPSRFAAYCSNLKEVELPEGLTSVSLQAFIECYYIHPELPNTLNTLEEGAFESTNSKGEIKTKLVIPESVTNIGTWVFGGTGYTEAVVPQSCNALTNKSGDFLPSSIKTLRLNSPTVIKTNSTKIGSLNYGAAKLVVPDYLVSSYKLDPYWYQFGTIVGFNTDEVDEWNINGDLILGARDRLLGTPSISISEYGSLKINGTDGMPVDNLCVKSDPDNNLYSRIFSNADGVSVAGDLDTWFRFGSTNRWYYLCLPYNIKVSDLSFIDVNSKRAIRYYDGANRAENGTGNNWKNYSDDDIIPAGTGFIFQISNAGWWSFPSLNDESKQYMTSNNMFVKGITAHDSDVASNSGWNLVGNPYQAWYNIHKINFTAPITVRNINNNTYVAYSIIDDDYALAPNQAFFVQCPEGTTEISFPLNGRQMTSEITDQNGAPAKNPQVSRVLVDLALNCGEMSDRTRVVLNNKASMSYETTCDASKFLSESNVAQVYTLDSEGTMYAINERPVQNGEIQLGVIIPENGTYSLSLLRNMTDRVYIRDNETGATVEITDEAYEFDAEAGTYNARFTVILESDVVTGIKNAPQDSSLNAQDCYNLAGQKVNEDYKGVVIRNGRKVVVK